MKSERLGQTHEDKGIREGCGQLSAIVTQCASIPVVGNCSAMILVVLNALVT